MAGFADWLDAFRHQLIHSRNSDLPPTGIVNPYYGLVAPTGWLLCDGSVIPAKYTALIALVGVNTPNLKGKVIVGLNSAEAEWDTLGETGGTKTSAIGTGNLPAHTHGLNGHSHSGATVGASVNHSHVVNSHDHGGGTGVHLHGVQLQFTAANPHSHAVGIGNAAEGPSGGGVGLSQNTTSSGVANTAQTPGTDGMHGGDPHPHTINGDSGATTDGGFAGTGVSILQPYAALSYIIKT